MTSRPDGSKKGGLFAGGLDSGVEGRRDPEWFDIPVPTTDGRTPGTSCPV